MCLQGRPKAVATQLAASCKKQGPLVATHQSVSKGKSEVLAGSSKEGSESLGRGLDCWLRGCAGSETLTRHFDGLLHAQGSRGDSSASRERDRHEKEA